MRLTRQEEHGQILLDEAHIIPCQRPRVNVQNRDLSYTHRMRQWLLIVILLLTGCGNPTVLDAFAPGNELVVITRNGPTTYYLARTSPQGLNTSYSTPLPTRKI